MKSRPILFSAPMIRALLDGRKTMTRRIVRPQPPENTTHFLNGIEREWGRWWPCSRQRQDYTGDGIYCPYGQPGDLLWVRETWAQNMNEVSDAHMDTSIVYRADTEERAIDNGEPLPWRPSIHMPRKYSRLTLRLTDVRVERLQEISEEDAEAEGIHCERCNDTGSIRTYGDGGVLIGDNCPDCGDGKKMYRAIWELINGPGSWDENPWVWVLQFDVINANEVSDGDVQLHRP